MTPAAHSKEFTVRGDHYEDELYERAFQEIVRENEMKYEREKANRSLRRANRPSLWDWLVETGIATIGAYALVVLIIVLVVGSLLLSVIAGIECMKTHPLGEWSAYCLSTGAAR
jgi:hypothetical protein